MSNIQVKSLSWRTGKLTSGKLPDGTRRRLYEVSPFGLKYEIFQLCDGENWSWRIRGAGIGGKCKSDITAKAEAQKHFDRLVLSHIEASVSDRGQE